MRLFSAILGFLFLVCCLEARQKMEVFELQNRDAESLVPVIASTLGPEARVTADTRTNSLIVAYPEEMGDNLRTIIAQLDRADPNIQIDVVTMDVETAWFEHLGLAGRSSIAPGDFVSLLPLLIEDKHATLVSRQSVVTRSNLPTQISLSTDGGLYHHGERPRAVSTVLWATPRLLADDVIELKLGHQSPSLSGDSQPGVGRIFSTVAILDGGAQIFEMNQESSNNKQVAITLIPIGLRKNTDISYRRIVFLSAKTTDYKDLPKE